MARDDSILGYFFIVVGLVLFIIGAWDLILRVLFALLGLYFINYGLLLNRLPPLSYTVNRILNIILGRRW